MECHLVQDMLDAHLLGALEKSVSDDIEKHLQNCSQCHKCLAETIKALDRLRKLPGIEPLNDYADNILSVSRKSKTSTPMLIAIIVVFVMLTLWLLSTLVDYRGMRSFRHLWELERAIWRYRAVHPVFPLQGGQHLTRCLLDPTQGGPYLQRREIFKISQSGEILDPWGTPYRYRYPGKHSSFDLYSCGKNKIDEQGQGDDICNWQLPKK